jgi:alkanesulfonate monooxygenase SsuD/methylene tetrahydromethanopterin reductase-like flavin-dependent oxidoreductase (luciferase family)
MVPIYVADTDEQAQREAAHHLMYLFQKLTHRPFTYLLPPGYATGPTLVRSIERLGRRTGMSAAPFEQLSEQGMVIFGSPDTVRRRLEAYQREMQFGILVPLLQFGTLPHDLTVRNMERFAREVMPALRPLGQPATEGVMLAR